MAKRFIDTELYDKDWFVALHPYHKLFWGYITSKCDTAGVWDINIITPCRILGIEIFDLDDFTKSCNADGKIRILIFPNRRKLFITTTIAFQYKNYLDENIFAHRGVINSIRNDEITEQWFLKEVESGNIIYVPKHSNNSNSDNKDVESCPSSYPNDYPNETPVIGGSLGYRNKNKNKNNIDRDKGGMGEKEESGTPPFQPVVKKITENNSLEEREQKFKSECEQYRDRYGGMIDDFVRYWTEPNKSNTKLKFEIEDTWELSRRLITWDKNNKTNFGRNNGSTAITRNKKQTLGNYGTRTSTL